MNVVSAFNNLNGKQVSRSSLKKLLTRAKRESHPLIAKRLSNLLRANKNPFSQLKLVNLWMHDD